SPCLSFFFQAEDGIRDFHVTGVQTCALPISAWSWRRGSSSSSRRRSTSGRSCAWAGAPSSARCSPTTDPHTHRTVEPKVIMIARSEERRVGKEGRSRGRTRETNHKKEQNCAK